MSNAVIQPRLPGNLERFRAMVPAGLPGQRMLALLIFTRSTATPERIAEVLSVDRATYAEHLQAALQTLRTDPKFHARFHEARNTLPDARFH